jgi:hypothetical protein
MKSISSTEPMILFISRQSCGSHVVNHSERVNNDTTRYDTIYQYTRVTHTRTTLGCYSRYVRLNSIMGRKYISLVLELQREAATANAPESLTPVALLCYIQRLQSKQFGLECRGLRYVCKEAFAT